MKNFIKDHRFIAGLLSIFISVFLVSIFAYGATTINNNIVTGIASTTESVRIGGDAGDDDDILYFDASEENLTWDNTASTFTLTDDLDITGWASTTSALNTQGTAHVGLTLSVDGTVTANGDVSIGGITTTTDYVYLPSIHFQQGVATATAPNAGDCFFPNNDLNCYDGANWVTAW